MHALIVDGVLTLVGTPMAVAIVVVLRDLL